MAIADAQVDELMAQAGLFAMDLLVGNRVGEYESFLGDNVAVNGVEGLSSKSVSPVGG